MLLTGFSEESEKNIFMMTSNSPQPVSVISYGGLVSTGDHVTYITMATSLEGTYLLLDWCSFRVT